MNAGLRFTANARGTFLCVLASAVAFILGAAPSDDIAIFPLRVPSNRVGDWFPPGTEVKGMSSEAFETLLRSAQAATSRRASVGPPRLLRAVHEAVWRDGLLFGRSEFVIEPPTGASAKLPLDPWSPAIEGGAEGSADVRSDDVGQTFLWVSPKPGGGTVKATVVWQLRSRPGSNGRKFALALPGTEAGSLTLDLPAGWEPEGVPGSRRGPDAPGTKGRAHWSFVGRTGACSLLLTDPQAADDAPGTPRAMVEGTTRIEVGEAAAGWTLDWTLRGGHRATHPLAIALDPGLSVLNVSGPSVEDFRAETADDGSTRLSVRFRNLGDGPTTVSVRALARVPSEGSWLVPSARPLNAIWTGGRTTVRLDSSRVLSDVRPLAGRRVPPPAGGTPEERRLVFEADRPEPVAALSLRRPWADLSAEVGGQLLVGGNSPRMNCRVTWRVDRGRPLGLAMDLPRSWFVERVEIDGAGELPAWHPEVRPDGSVRLHVTPPSGDLPGGALAVNVWASATVAGGRGPLALPRVRPVGTRVADEIWVARAEPGMTLQPTQARGLAWVDPASVLAGALKTEADAEGLRPALAWRWTADDGEARVERGWAEPAPHGTVELVATVRPARLSVHARVVVLSRGEPVRSVVLGLSDPIVDQDGWRVTDEATGLVLPRTPLPSTGRGGTAASGRGPWWSFELPQPQHGRVTLNVRYEGRWDGRGRVPLVVLPAALRPRGTALVLAGRDIRTSAVMEGGRTLDAGVVAESLSADWPPGVEAAGSTPTSELRRAHAFAYEGTGPSLELRTESLAPGSKPGLIREAVLTDVLVPTGGGEARSRLVLKVAAEQSSSLDVVLPPGSRLERVQRDGAAVIPTVSGETLSIPLGGSGTVRPLAVVTLDYQAGPASRGDTTRVRPKRPWFSMPCLSLSWELIVPEPFSVADWGPALTPTDPAVVRPGLWERIAGGRTSWTWLQGGVFRRRREKSRPSASAVMLGDLDARVSAGHVDEIGLGEWLTRLDAGRWPLVVDRAALAKTGWGPRSRVAPSYGEPSKPKTAREVFRGLGLVVVPVGRVFLITTADERPADLANDTPTVRSAARGRWETALSEAAVWGSDASDRYQAVGRWRETSLPRANAPVEVSGTEAVGPGRTAWRFVAVGWPDAGVEVRLVDRRAQAATGWTVAFAVLILGLTTRRLPRQVRAAGTAGLLGLGLLSTALVPPWFAGAALGLTGGAFALILFWTGAGLPRIPGGAARNPRGTDVQRRLASGSGYASPAALVVAVVGLSAPWAVALAQNNAAVPKATAILALYPYDGAPDPSKVPDRVLLRLSDFERLRSVTQGSRASSPASLAATAAVHRLSWQGQEALSVESELTLVATGEGYARWAFPVGEARSLTASIEDEEIPVRIDPGGKTAAVVIELAEAEPENTRTIHLRLRRTIVPRRGDGVDTIILPINPVATARIEVAPHPKALRVELPNVRGQIDDRGENEGYVGRLGPVDRVDVRWTPPGETRPTAASGSVEGLYLWDAVPAGDRVRARLTYRNPAGTPVVRVRLDPGAVVRDFSIPGGVDVSMEGPPARPEWVARIDPPLPDGATVSLDVWRPGAASKAPSGTDDAAPSVLAARNMPNVELLGVERAGGAVAFRRPADWTGRMAPVAGAEALGEEAFVRAWGNLPGESLTLSGAIRLASTLSRPAQPSVEAGPRPLRVRVQPAVQVAVSPGRLDLTFDAEFDGTDDPVYDVELALPEKFRLDRIAADGLTDWERPAAGVLRLRFDGLPARRRKVRVRGWTAVDGDPLAAIPPSREVEIPWPRWRAQEQQSVALTVVSPTRFQLVRPTGKSPVLAEPAAPGSAQDSTIRATYQIGPADAPGMLRWEVEPPRVAVFVRSQVTLDPDTAEWMAVLRYEVYGGPLDQINLGLPSSWARGASVWLEGVGHQQVTLTKGENTFWEIRPERPVWGSQRLVVRSTVPFVQGESRTFPELKPRGWGKTDTYLRLVNATRRPIAVEGKLGVRPVAPQSFQGEDELMTAPPRGADTSIYHVFRPDWSLRVQKPGPAGNDATDVDTPRVSRADLNCSVAVDGTVLGVGRFELGPSTEAFLPVGLPTGSAPLWATVNGVTIRPLVAGPGRWLIPLPEAPGGRVALVWRSEPSTTDPADTARPLGPQARPIPLPAVGGGRMPTAVTVYAPAGSEVSGLGGRFSPAGPGRIDLEEARWLSVEISGALPAFDRSSRRDAEELVANLIRFESLLRLAERAAAFEPSSTSTLRGMGEGQMRLATQRLRDRVAESVRNAALDEYMDAARVHLGLTPQSPATNTVPTSDVPTLVQVRAIGRPHGFLGEQQGPDGKTASLAWTPGGIASAGERVWLWTLTALAASAPFLAWLATRSERLIRPLGRVALIAGLAILGFWSGLAWLAAGFGFAVLGRFAKEG